MWLEQQGRFAAFITASLLLHAAALAWLDLSGADVGRLPSKLTVLLASRGDADDSRVTRPPASASRSRDLFQRPPAPAAKVAPTIKAEPPSAIAEAAPPPQRVAGNRAKRAEPKTPAAAEAKPAPAHAAENAGAEDFAADPAAVETGPAAAADAGAAQRRGELLLLLHQAISREKRYPLLALRQRREGTTTVTFSLSPSGEMDAIGVDRSSGFSPLDNAAVSAVSRVAPFGPARLFLSEETRFKVNVTFTLN